MGRNANGVYNLPEPPFTGHTPIVATPVNSNMNDIASALTMSIATSGQTAMSGQIKVSYGSADAPSYTFANDEDTGFYYSSNNGDFIFVAGGSAIVAISTDGSIEWYGEFIVDGDVGIQSITYENLDAGILEINTSAVFSSQVDFQNADLSGASYIFEDIHADDDISVVDGFLELSVLTSASASVASGSIRLYVEEDNLVYKNDADIVSYTDWRYITNDVSTTTKEFLAVDLSKFADGTYDEILIVFHSLQYNLSNVNDVIYWFGDDIPFQFIMYTLSDNGFVDTFGSTGEIEAAIIDCSSGILPITFKVHLKKTSQNRVYYTLKSIYNTTVAVVNNFVVYVKHSGLINGVPDIMGFRPSNENGGANFSWRRYNYSVYGRKTLNAP